MDSFMSAENSFLNRVQARPALSKLDRQTREDRGQERDSPRQGGAGTALPGSLGL